MVGDSFYKQVSSFFSSLNESIGQAWDSFSRGAAEIGRGASYAGRKALEYTERAIWHAPHVLGLNRMASNRINDFLGVQRRGAEHSGVKGDWDQLEKAIAAGYRVNISVNGICTDLKGSE